MVLRARTTSRIESPSNDGTDELRSGRSANADLPALRVRPARALARRAMPRVRKRDRAILSADGRAARQGHRAARARAAEMADDDVDRLSADDPVGHP